MIKISVMYPGGENARFDMDYYLGRHMPMVRERLGAALLRSEVDAGLSGARPGSKPPFVAIAHLYFDSLDAYAAAFAPHGKAIMADIPNYTDIVPSTQVSEVR